MFGHRGITGKVNEVINEDKDNQIRRVFYSGELHATDIDSNFIHISLTKGSWYCKMNRKDLDSLTDIIEELKTKMDSFK